MPKRVQYTDPHGRKITAVIPDGAPDSLAPKGIRVGPPDLSSLGLTMETEVRLHNYLADSGILTADDARRQPDLVAAAVRNAFRLDTHRVLSLYGV